MQLSCIQQIRLPSLRNFLIQGLIIMALIPSSFIIQEYGQAQDTKHTAGSWTMGKPLWNISDLTKRSLWMPSEFTVGLSNSASCCQQCLCQ